MACNTFTWGTKVKFQFAGNSSPKVARQFNAPNDDSSDHCNRADKATTTTATKTTTRETTWKTTTTTTTMTSWTTRESLVPALAYTNSSATWAAAAACVWIVCVYCKHSPHTHTETHTDTHTETHTETLPHSPSQIANFIAFNMKITFYFPKTPSQHEKGANPPSSPPPLLHNYTSTST